MKKLCTRIGVFCVVALLTRGAFGLEIQLSPPTLVLSSGVSQLTIHTDFFYGVVDTVALDIGNSSDIFVTTWADDCGNLVVRCSKAAVKEAVGDFKDKFTTVNVTLTVTAEDGSVESASESLRVKK